MTMPNIFDAPLMAVMQEYSEKSKKAAVKIPLFIGSVLFHGLITFGVMLFEFELLYRVFSYLSPDSEYWTPEVMGLSSFIMVVAIHFIAERNKKHVAIRAINAIAGTSAILYALGIGLLVALILFLDGQGLFDIENFASITPAETDEPVPNWVTWAMAHVASPLGSLLFSLGVGALAIINIFVAHHALDKVKHGLTEISARRAAYQADKADIDTFMAAEDAYRELAEQKAEYVTKSDESIMMDVANDVVMNIHEAIRPMAHMVNNQVLLNNLTDALPQSSLNVEQAQKALKPLQAITTDQLVSIMKSDTKKS